MKNTIRITLLSALLLLSVMATFGNNVAISGLTYLSGSDQIRFNVTWDNSWRNTATAGSTQNYDGVWVFVKFRHACAKDSIYPSASDYTHMWLSTTTSDHVVPSGAALEVGTTNFSSTPRGMGIFLYRNSDGTGTTTFNNVTLKWAKAAQGITGTDWDVQVFAVEMVNIPQGPFTLGDGFNASSYGSISNNEFSLGSTSDPYLVTSEDSIPMGNATGQLSQRQSTSTSSFVSPMGYGNYIGSNTPKGYASFWCMKYEVTQKQFVDFLNTLSRASQKFIIRNINMSNQITLGDTSVNDNSTSNDEANLGFFYNSWSSQRSYGNGITVAYTGGISATNKIVPGSKPWTFACDLNNNGIFNESDDGMNTACNFLGTTMLWAYLDWAALRPMNEFEFEKVCRGPSTVAPFIPQVDAFVWGSFGVSANVTTTSGSWTGARTISEAPSAPISSTGLVIAGESTGPRRVGATNRAGSTRIQSGTSYYGVCNMADNVQEVVIRFGSYSCYSSSTGWCINYNRTAYGDGNINTIKVRTYICDNDKWPYNWNTNILESGVCTRGGAANTTDYSLFGISNRNYAGQGYFCGGSYSPAWAGGSYGSPDCNNGGGSMDELYGCRIYSGSVMSFSAFIGGRGVR